MHNEQCFVIIFFSNSNELWDTKYKLKSIFQVITNHQSTTQQTDAAGTNEHQHLQQRQRVLTYNNSGGGGSSINSHQTQAVNLSNKSSCTTSTSLQPPPYNDLNGKGGNITFTGTGGGPPSLNSCGLKVAADGGGGGNMKIVNISGCISHHGGSQVVSSNLVEPPPSNVQSISIVKPAVTQARVFFILYEYEILI